MLVVCLQLALSRACEAVFSSSPHSVEEEAMGHLLQAPTDDCRVRIVQRGAVPPLVQMLKTQDRSLREMAAFALGRLAQNSDNQAGIFVMGAVPPLLELLDSGIKNLEHNAAFTLYGLADNVDNVPELVKCGAYERLRVADFPDDQPTKDCIVKTLKRIAVCSISTLCQTSVTRSTIMDECCDN